MKNQATHEILYDGNVLLIEGTYEPGDRGDYENAPDPDRFRIEKIVLDLFDGIEITELVPWENRHQFELQILNEHY